MSKYNLYKFTTKYNYKWLLLLMLFKFWIKYSWMNNIEQIFAWNEEKNVCFTNVQIVLHKNENVTFWSIFFSNLPLIPTWIIFIAVG